MLRSFRLHSSGRTQRTCSVQNSPRPAYICPDLCFEERNWGVGLVKAWNWVGKPDSLHDVGGVQRDSREMERVSWYVLSVTWNFFFYLTEMVIDVLDRYSTESVF